MNCEYKSCLYTIHYQQPNSIYLFIEVKRQYLPFTKRANAKRNKALKVMFNLWVPLNVLKLD